MNGINFWPDGVSVYSTFGGTSTYTLRAIKHGGKLLSLIVDLDEDMKEKLQEKNVTGARVFLRADQGDLQSIADLMAAGKIKTHVSRVFTLAQMPQAHALIQTKNAVGKIIVAVN
jgi:NADPH:quinone reductase-like Zn-dependent oxidoreductase